MAAPPEAVLRDPADPPAAPAPAAQAGNPYTPQAFVQSLLTKASAGRASANAAVDSYVSMVGMLGMQGVPTLDAVPPDLQAKYDAALAAANEIVLVRERVASSLDQVMSQADDERTQAEAAAAGGQLNDSTRLVSAAIGKYQGIEEQIPVAMGELADHALALARLGKEVDEADYVAKMLTVADEAFSRRVDPPARPDFRGVASKSSKSDWADLGFTGADIGSAVMEVVITSVGFGVAAVASGAAAQVAGVAGAIFAPVGLLLALWAWRHSTKTSDRLEGAEKFLTDQEARQAATYAGGQQAKKAKRQKVMAAVGVGAATVAAIAVSGVTTLGVAPAIVGILFAVGTLGLGVARYIHRRRKRSAEKQLAMDKAETIKAAAAQGDAAAQQVLAEYDTDEKLLAYCQMGGSERSRVATEIVGLLCSQKPSERFNGETIVEALGLQPAQLLEQVAADNAGAAVGEVAGALSSW